MAETCIHLVIILRFMGNPKKQFLISRIIAVLATVTASCSLAGLVKSSIHHANLKSFILIFIALGCVVTVFFILRVSPD